MNDRNEVAAERVLVAFCVIVIFLYAMGFIR